MGLKLNFILPFYFYKIVDKIKSLLYNITIKEI
nr:MAG TPA: hypothetical protein [Caudoviricetes sp.]